jgi:hypothetical protein
VNVVFAKDKIGVNPNGLQITYFLGGQTRSLFVYADDPKVKDLNRVKNRSYGAIIY